MSPFSHVRSIAVLAVAAAGVLVPASAVRADPEPYHRDLEAHAFRLRHEVREFDRQVDENFRFTPQYERLLRHTVEMQRLSNHIAYEARYSRDIRHLRADVERMEDLYRLIRSEIEFMGRLREIDRRAYYRLQSELDDVGVALRHLDRELYRRCELYR
jgi:hypothetical protein